MKKVLLLIPFFFLQCSMPAGLDTPKTTFQTSRGWKASMDNRADAVMVYGVGGNPSDTASAERSVEHRVRSWREKGYRTAFMTGIAWGNYQDYFTGEWDGRTHFDEGQKQMSGDTIWHGPMVPYVVPTENYLEYFKEKHLKRVIDAGIDEIFLEEPEFWSRAGYSEAFKREWKDYYGFDWMPQDQSPSAAYLSAKLKYQLYYRALEETMTYAKEYGRTRGLKVRCYVPTHSLINYSQWQIVSPEASLASLDCVDGYIAQVWTGTARTPNFFDGRLRERVFDTAFLEYGCMSSMTEPTGRKVYFLTDPVEDGIRDWEDYRKNYQATFTAQLMYPRIADYEIMPWPERIYEGRYRVRADSEEEVRIPRDYATMMQVMIGSLNKMPVSDNKVSGSQGVSILMSNSLMFQRVPDSEGRWDIIFSRFYGLTLPLLKRGVPVSMVHMENLRYAGSLADTKVLIMTYSSMKPLEPTAHGYLAEWVRKGGTLVYCGRDDDPFQTVPEWWNSGENHYACPSDHLFGLMGMEASAAAGEYRFGKGKVRVIRQDPEEFNTVAGGDSVLVSAVSELYAGSVGTALEMKNSFLLERGPYDVVAVLDEGVSDEPFEVKGTLIDLYDPSLPVMDGARLKPGDHKLFLNMDRIHRSRPSVVASASREYDEKAGRHSYSYVAKGPEGTTGISRVLLPSVPKSVKVNGAEVFSPDLWDSNSGTYLLGFDNNPDGVDVVFRF